MKVRDIIATKGSRVITAWPNKRLDEIMKLMAERNIASVLIVDPHDHPIGIISERIVLRELSRSGAAGFVKTARQVIAGLLGDPLPVCSLDDSAGTVMRRMTDKRYRHAVAMDGDHIAGIVSIGDLVKVRLDDAEVESKVLRDMALSHMAAE